MKFHIPKIQRRYKNTEAFKAIWEYFDLLRLRLGLIFEGNIDGSNIAKVPADKLSPGIYKCESGSLILGADRIRIENNDGSQYIELKDGSINIKGNIVT